MTSVTGEQAELQIIFAEMLLGPTLDGGKKRAAGTKESWKTDTGHVKAIFSHLGKWVDGDGKDLHSGSHPLVHCAWRCLAVAYQEEQEAALEYNGDAVLDLNDDPRGIDDRSWDC